MASNETKNPIICMRLERVAPETYQYNKDSLNESELAQDPIVEFTKWFADAKNDPTEMIPEAVNFSSAELPSGRVSSRILLFKELDERGFTIYSNWETSRKAQDIRSNPQAALTFFWRNLQRQVRVEGIVEKVSRETSERYFNTRPRGSKVGAWSSPQSAPLKDRAELQKLVDDNEARFEGVEEVPCPDFWGGVRIVPLMIEFWQGRPSRLHDRIVFKRESEKDPWQMLRIAP